MKNETTAKREKIAAGLSTQSWQLAEDGHTLDDLIETQLSEQMAMEQAGLAPEPQAEEVPDQPGGDQGDDQGDESENDREQRQESEQDEALLVPAR